MTAQTDAESWGQLEGASEIDEATLAGSQCCSVVHRSGTFLVPEITGVLLDSAIDARFCDEMSCVKSSNVLPSSMVESRVDRTLAFEASKRDLLR